MEADDGEVGVVALLQEEGGGLMEERKGGREGGRKGMAE